MKKRQLLSAAAIAVAASIPFLLPEKKPLLEPLQPMESHRSDDDEGEDHEGREEYLNFRLSGNNTLYNWKEEYGKVRRKSAEARMARRKGIMSRGAIPPMESVGNGVVTGEWIERGAKNQAGRVVVTDVLEDKNMVVLGTAGGSVMYGPLTGNDYEILNDQMRFTLRSVHSFELQDGTVRIVAVDKYGVYITDNRGLTWERTYNGTLVSATISRTDNILYVITSSGSVISSNDKAGSFTSVGSTRAANGYEIWTPRYASGDLYVLAGTAVYRKSAAGFTHVGTISGSNSAKISISGDNKIANSPLYASYNTGSGTDVFKSTNDGVSWTKKGSTTEGMFEVNSFAVISEDTLYVGGVHCMRSTNDGVSWMQVNGWTEYYDVYGGNPETKLHADIPEIRTYRDSSGTDMVLLSTDGGTYITYNNRTYKNITMTGMRNNQYYGLQSRWDDPDIILAGAQDQGAQMSQPANGDTIMDFYQYMSGDQGSYTSSDSGKSSWFTYIYGALYYHPDTKTMQAYNVGKPSESDNFLWMAATVADPANPEIVYTGGSSVYKTTYNGSGQASHSTHSNSSLGATITALAISPVDNNHWYAATKRYEFYHSSDRGKTWTKMSGKVPGNHWLVGQSIVADPTVLGRVYLCGNGNGSAAVFVSENHGNSFDSTGTDVPTTSVLDMTFNNDGSLLFAAAYDAAYVYVVAEQKWYNLTGNTGPDTPYFMVEYLPTIQTVRFATHGRGIWDFKMGDVVEPDPFVTINDVATDTYLIGDTVAIAWTTNLDEDVTLALLRDGSVESELGTLAATAKSFSWVIPEDIDTTGEFTIEITASGSGLSSVTTTPFSIVNLKKLPQSELSVESFSSQFSDSYGAILAIDGLAETFWHNKTDGTDDLDADIVFKLNAPTVLTAFSYLTRQDGSEDSHIENFELQVSSNGTDWTTVQTGTWDNATSEKIVVLDAPTSGVEYVKLVALSSTNGKEKAAVAEFNLFYNEMQEVNALVQKKAAPQFGLLSVTQNQLNLSIAEAGNYSVKIYSLDGRVLFSQNRHMASGVHQVDLRSRGLAKQIGVLSVKGADVSLNRKIAIK